MTPYYAEPGFAPPPFLETLDDPTDGCWKNGCARLGNGRLGLCSDHFEELREGP